MDDQIQEISSRLGVVERALSVTNPDKPTGDVAIVAGGIVTGTPSVTGYVPMLVKGQRVNVVISDTTSGGNSTDGRYGDGSDGVVDLDGSNTYSFLSKSSSVYTLTRDTYFSNVTIRTGVTLQTAGFVPFAYSLTREGTGIITNNGGNGGNGGDGDNGINTSGGPGGTAGAAGAAAPGGTLPASKAGKIGATGGAGNVGSGPATAGSNGTAGAAASNALVDNGAAGVGGGAGGTANTAGGSGGSGASGGLATLSGSVPRDLFYLRAFADWLSGVWTRFSGSGGSASGGGGGGGGGNGTNGGGGGGGSGGSGGEGGYVVAFIKSIVASNTNALFQAKGGNGGRGGNGGSATFNNPGFQAAGGGGAAGGSSGNGGVVGVVYSSSDQTVSSLIDVSAGSVGAPGTAGAASGSGPTAAVAGTVANAGVVGLKIILAI